MSIKLWINKTWHSNTTKCYSTTKKWSFDTCYNVDIPSKHFVTIRSQTQKRPSTVLFCFYKISRIEKSIKTVNKLLFAPVWWMGKGVGSDCSECGLLFGFWWCSGIRLWWWLQNLETIFKTSELYAIKWWILWY